MRHPGDAHHVLPVDSEAQDLISLTYFSSASVAFSDQDLQELLAHSRVRNAEADVTGLLLHVDGHFVQTLEGPAERVDATFARICADTRHRNVLTALREDIEQREFPDWSMGFKVLDPETAATLPGYNDYLETSGATTPVPGRPGIFHRMFRDQR